MLKFLRPCLLLKKERRHFALNFGAIGGMFIVGSRMSVKLSRVEDVIPNSAMFGGGAVGK